MRSIANILFLIIGLVACQQGDRAIDSLDAPTITEDPIAPDFGERLIDEVKGRVIEFFPDTMYTRKTYRVSVRVTSDTSLAVLQREIASNETLRSNPEEVKSFLVDGLGEEMVAKLVDTSPEDDKNFRIVPIFENSIRPVDLVEGRVSRWEWDVYPLKKGQHQLSLVLERVVDKGTGDLFPILDRKIIVLVEKNPYTLFLYLAIALLILGGAGIYFWKRARSKTALSFAFQAGDYNQIRTLIASNDTEEALSSLQKLELPQNYAGQVLMLLSRLNRISERARMGTSDETDLDIERNRVNAELLELLEEMKKATAF